MAPTSPYILTFEQCDTGSHARVGGKCASLGAMIQAGAPVPPGFAVTTEAYQEMLATGDLGQHIRSQLETLDPNDVNRIEAISQAVRALIEQTPVAAGIEQAIRAAYADLCQRCAMDEVPVAVRSSATAEDLPGASFAGQQDTFLWIVGIEEVLKHVRKCWSSLYTARAITYRLEKGFPHEKISMSVGVQKMVNPKAAGVAFTLNPINGDRSKIAIDSSWGLGEAVVAGEVTPDNFLIDKVIFEVVSRAISPKHIEYVLDPAANRVVQRAVEPERQMQPSLTEEELVAVAKMAKRAERFYGNPQDVEWAVDADLAPPDNVVILQSRPETVWSQQARPSISAGKAAGMAGLVDTLITGVRIKPARGAEGGGKEGA
ncbi:MAG: PEP/pyruvate-binding domain-containing protein [Anaerolineae bacterium]